MCKVIWRYRRDEDSQDVTQYLAQAIAALEQQPYVLVVDLRSIRYILPDDKQVFFTVYENLSFVPLETLYLVDIRNYHRMQLLISFNQFPHPDLVFKYELDALEYLKESQQARKSRNNTALSKDQLHSPS